MTDHHSSNPPLSELDAEALAWFARTGRGALAEQDADLQAWLRVDPARRQAFERWQHDWQALDNLPADGIAQLRRQLALDKAAASAALAVAPAVAPSVSADSAADLAPAKAARTFVPPASAGRRTWLRNIVPQAAVVMMMLSVSGGSYLAWDHWQQQPVYTQEFATERGQQLDLQLPDGSRLRLDTATRVAVTLYRQRREVLLTEGQAVFQVQADPAKPFDVLAGPMQVTVVGTRFSVRHTAGVPGDDGVRVAVEEGRVRVKRASKLGVKATGAESGAAEDAQALELGAGQQVSADLAGDLTPVAAVSAAGIAPWRDGRVTFDNTPLAQALAEFERYGQTGLTVRDPAVAALRLTGTFDPQRLGNFLLALPKVLPVRLRTDAAGTEIVASR
ncbi:Fe2+-dicitrate sensor protein [Pigmentiphaga aceris]|uniref:Fe2+-dicitrate sensor protein n=1 Tax=Pigmentiphaga aceris TaxID=1940612 RepID=A0A5C0AVC6_9BURK|nr:FecR domain-containing protein [Pigmentiphaga aceris]QEI05303.1 Fe2+-dicitrate sensor protein [Pigmentiphaga aceris]